MIIPNNKYFKQQWPLRVIQAPEAWQFLRDISSGALGDTNDLTFGSSDIIVAVIDSGLESETVNSILNQYKAKNESFVAPVSSEKSKVVAFLKIVDARTVIHGNNHPDGLHGTGVSGLSIANCAHNLVYQGGGIAGVAGNCRLISIQKNKNDFGIGLNTVTIFDSTNKIQLSKGADVVNMSIAIPAMDSRGARKSDISSFVNKFIYSRNGRGTVIVASAGNKNVNTLDYQHLATTPNILIIGATTIHDDTTISDLSTGNINEVKAGYSAYGARVDFVAPAGDDDSTGKANYKYHRQFTSALKNTGSVGGQYPIQKSIVSHTKKNKITLNNVWGLFPGNYIEIGDPAMWGKTNPASLEVAFIISIDQGAKEITLNKNLEHLHTTGYITCSSLQTKTKSASTARNIEVEEIQGFAVNQEFFIGDPLIGGDIHRITKITGNIVEFASTTKAYISGTTIIVSPIRYTRSGSANVGYLSNSIQASKIVGEVQMANINIPTQGLLVGQKLKISSDLHDITKLTPPQTVQVRMSITGSPSSISSVQAVGFGDYINDFNGTSGAAPIASGVVALMLSANPRLSFLEVKQLLYQSAFRLHLEAKTGDHVWYEGTEFKSSLKIINGTSLAKVLGKVKVSTAIAPLQESIEVDVLNNLDAGSVIQVDSREFAVVINIEKSTTKNILHLDRPLRQSYSANQEVEVGPTIGRSKDFGLGRVNAKNAVKLAYAYNQNILERSFLVRDSLADDGLSDTDPLAIQSPDIWIRKQDPSINLIDAYPSGHQTDKIVAYGNLPPHEEPIIEKDGSSNESNYYICVRLRNIGKRYATLKGAKLIISISSTDNPTPSLQFPNSWMTINRNSNDGYYESFSNLFELDIPELEKFEEQDSITILFDRSNLRSHISFPPTGAARVFLKAHITPFDGDRTGIEIHQNTNLSVREIFPMKVEMKRLSGEDILGSNLKIKIGVEEIWTRGVYVNNTGEPEDYPFRIDWYNIPEADYNTIEIRFEITLEGSSTPEVVTFNKNGASWEVDASFPWLPAMEAEDVNPTLIESGKIRLATFLGRFSLLQTHKFLTVTVEIKDSSGASLLKNIEYIQILPEKPENGVWGASDRKSEVLSTFTDFDQLIAQPSLLSYGSLSSTEYRVCSLFPASATTSRLPAFAMLGGSVCLQEVDADTVNLILKPNEQIPQHYTPVKYIVYRGLRMDSFIVGGQVKDADASDLSQLLQEMWVDNKNRNSERAKKGLPTQLLKLEDLGLNGGSLPIDEKKLLSDFFEENTFHPIKRRKYIGDFNKNNLHGIQIILEGDYEPTLKEMRVIDHKVKIGLSEVNFPSSENIRTKLKRQKILSFIDPVAYYALGSDQKIQYTTMNPSTNKIISKPIENDEIVTKILDKFATNNRIYLDIRDELNQAVSFSGNYDYLNASSQKETGILFFDETVKKKDIPDQLVVQPYHDGYGWPIITIDHSSFKAKGDEHFPMNIGLPMGSETNGLTNPTPLLYLSGARFNNDFIFPDRPQSSLHDRFEYLSQHASTDRKKYSELVQLGIPFSRNLRRLYPFTMRISLCKRYDTDNLPIPTYPSQQFYKLNLLDNIFYPSGSRVNRIPDYVNWRTNESLLYLGWTSLKENTPDFTVKTGVAKDQIGEITYAFRHGPSENNGETSSTNVKASLDLHAGKSKHSSFYRNYSVSIKWYSELASRQKA
jgi:subtilisin family serine protease